MTTEEHAALTARLEGALQSLSDGVTPTIDELRTLLHDAKAGFESLVAAAFSPVSEHYLAGIEAAASFVESGARGWIPDRSAQIGAAIRSALKPPV